MMKALVKDFFRAWEDEIAAYQEVSKSQPTDSPAYK